MQIEKKSLLQYFQQEYFCPITQSPVQNPVMTIDGLTYEQESLQTWFKYNRIEPQTKRQLQYTGNIQNIALKRLMSKLNVQIPKIELEMSEHAIKISELEQEVKELKTFIEEQKQIPVVEIISQKSIKKTRSAKHKLIYKELGAKDHNYYFEYRGRVKQVQAQRQEINKLKKQTVKSNQQINDMKKRIRSLQEQLIRSKNQVRVELNQQITLLKNQKQQDQQFYEQTIIDIKEKFVQTIIDVEEKYAQMIFDFEEKFNNQISSELDRINLDTQTKEKYESVLCELLADEYARKNPIGFKDSNALDDYITLSIIQRVKTLNKGIVSQNLKFVIYRQRYFQRLNIRNKLVRTLAKHSSTGEFRVMNTLKCIPFFDLSSSELPFISWNNIDILEDQFTDDRKWTILKQNVYRFKNLLTIKFQCPQIKTLTLDDLCTLTDLSEEEEKIGNQLEEQTYTKKRTIIFSNISHDFILKETVQHLLKYKPLLKQLILFK